MYILETLKWRNTCCVLNYFTTNILPRYNECFVQFNLKITTAKQQSIPADHTARHYTEGITYTAVTTYISWLYNF